MMAEEEAAGLALECPKCGHKWTYTGKKLAGLAAARAGGYALTTSCPRCHKTNVRIEVAAP